jgi:hypothetical protein
MQKARNIKNKKLQPDELHRSVKDDFWNMHPIKKKII